MRTYCFKYSHLSQAVRALTCVLTMSITCVHSAPVLSPTPQDSPTPINSSLNAGLFYQLLVGELELRSGNAGTSYELLLDAAKKTKDETLFSRATEIALQARAGDQALAAAKAWRDAVPGSLDAHRYLVQILVALNRAAEAADPLSSLLKVVPASDRPALIGAVPQFFSRMVDRQSAADIVQKILQPYLDLPETRTMALVSTGRALASAGKTDAALDMAQKAHALDLKAVGPALFALELMSVKPVAASIVESHLQANPANHRMRLLYARTLVASQRYGEAASQLEQLTRNQPAAPEPWLFLGELRLELHQPAEATLALTRYIDLSQSQPAQPSITAPESGTLTINTDVADMEINGAQGMTQAWLMLSLAAEQQRDFKAAEKWLDKIDDPERKRDVQQRRASLLARQGKLNEARALIRSLPEKDATEARAKILAETQLLRDAKQWSQAETLLAKANQRFPDDTDLLYEQSMIAEKLNRIDEMERLLRRVMELKPNHHHAYNALGYSLAERNIRLPEARSLIQHALELSPGDPFIIDSLAWVEYRMGHSDEAVRLLRTAFQARPDIEIGAHLGEVLWMNGQRDEALRIWRQAKARDEKNDVLSETLKRLQVKL